MNKSKKVKGLFKFKKSTPDLSDWGKHDDKLLIAIENGDLEKVDSILTKKGVLPTKLGPNGISAFHVAAVQGNVQMVNLLLTHKADATARDAQGRVPLHCAARAGSGEICEKLINVHNDCATKDNDCLIPLHHACLGGHIECCKLLLNNMSPANAPDKRGQTPLFIAAQSGHPAICRDLIENDAEIDARDNERCTPLMLAAKFGNRGVCEYLVRKGANVSLTDNDDHDVIWYAQNNDHPELISIFENAPTRASWTLDTEQDDSIISDNQELHSPRSELSSDVSEQPNGRVVQHEEDIASLEQVDVGIVPFHEEKDSSFEEVQTSFESDHREPVRQRHTPSSLASVSEEEELRTEERASKADTVNIEEFRELEEEHESLVQELERVNQEKRRLEEQVERLHHRWDEEAVKRKKTTNVDATTILEIEQELDGLKSDLDTERQKNTELEDQVRHYRKKYDLDSKPESERADKDAWSDSDGELFDSPHAKESKTLVLLRSQIHALNKENDALKETIQMCGGDGTGDTEINLRRRLTDLEAENARMTELLAEYEGLENEFHEIKRARSSTSEELEAVQEAKAQLQNKVTQLQQENEQMKNIVENSLDKAGVTKEMRALSAKIDELQEENEVLKRKSMGSIEDLTKEVALLSTKNNELEAKYSESSDDVWEEKMNELKMEINRLNSQVHNLETENRDLQGSMNRGKLNPFEDHDEDREELFTYLQQTIADLQQENVQLKQGHFPEEFRAQDDLKRLQASMSRMTEDNETLSQRLNSAMDTLRRTQCELDAAEDQVKSSSAELHVTRAQLTDSQDRLGHLVLKLQNAEENLEKERSGFHVERSNFNEECKRLQEELNKARVEASSQNNNTMTYNSSSDPDDNPIVHVMQLERDMYGSEKAKKEAVKRIGRHLTEIYSENENLKHQLALSEENSQKDAEQIYQLQMQNISINEKLADEQQHHWKEQKRFQDLERQVESQSITSIQSSSSWSSKNEKDLEALVEKLREENASMKHQLANVGSRRESLQTAYDRMKSDKDRLQAERERLQMELASSSEQRNGVNGHLQRLLFSVETLQTVSCSLTGHERKQYETDLEQVHGTLKNLLEGEVVPAGDTEWTEEREQIWRHMRDEVIKMRQEHQATVDENEELLRDKERLAAELQTATEKHRAGERDLYRIHQDRIRMEEQVTLIKQLQQEISSLKDENKKSPVHIDTLQHEITRLQEDNNNMAMQLQNLEAQHQRKMEKYTSEIHQAHEEKEQLRRLSESLESPDKVLRLQRDIHDLQEENTQLSMQLDRRDSQQTSLMMSLQQEVSVLKERERQQEQQMSDLSKHDRNLIDELQQQIVQLKEMNDNMKGELEGRKHQERSTTESLQNDLSRLRQHNEGLRIELNSRHENIEALQREVKALGERNQKLSAQLEGSVVEEALLTKLQSEKTGLQQELKSLSERNTKMAIQSERRSSQDHQHMTQLQSELLAANAEKSQLQTDIHRQEGEIRDLRKQLQKIPAGLNIEEVMQESAALKREIADLKQRDMMIVVTGQKGDAKLKEDFDYLSKQSDTMRQEMENLRTSLEQERQRSLKKLQLENDRLRSKLAEMAKEHKELRTSLLRLQNSAGVNGDESPHKSDRSLSRSNSDIERHCRLLQQENKELQSKVKRLGQSQNRLEIQQCYEEIERLQRVTQAAEKILIKELAKLNPSFKSCCNLQELLSVIEKTDLSRYSQDKEPSDLRSSTISRLEGDIRQLIQENQELRAETQRSKLKPRGTAEGSPDRQHQALQRQVARLQRQLEEADQRHREVVATYRTHLLSAMQGQMDGEVQSALKHIVKLRTSEQFC